MRRSPQLRASWRRSLLLGASLVGVGAVACVGLVAWGRSGMRDPEIARLIDAEESFVTAGCEWDSTRFGVEVCVGGSKAPEPPTVLLVGDSHASQWMAAYAAAGERNGFEVALRASTSCAAAGTRPTKAGEPQANLDTCRRYQVETDRLIESGEFSAVIVSDSVGSRPSDPAAWADQMAGFVDRAEWAKTRVGVMTDNPAMGEVLRCVARGQGDRCLVSRADATGAPTRYQRALDPLERRETVEMLDLTQAACPEDPCPVEVGGVIVPARAGHLNRAFTLTQVPALSSFVDRLLQR